MKKDRSILFYILSFLSFLFGLLSKEAVAITIPLVLVGYDLYFTPKTKILQIIRKNIKYYIPYGILPVLYVMLGSSHLGLSKRVTTVFQDLRVAANIAGASEIAIFGIWCKAVPQYLRLLFLPYNLCAAYPISCPSSIFEISVLLSFFLCIVFIVFIVKSYKYCSEASFGLFWILATLLPVLNIIPVTPHFLAERYLYAPSIGFCIFIAVMINKIYYQQIRIFSQGFQKKFAVFLILMVLVLYSLLTFQRNLDWKSDYTLWSKTVCQKPESGIAHWNLAVVYDSEGQYDKAIEEFKKVIPFYPRNALLHYGLGTTYLRKGLYDEAVKELKQALQINPKLGDAYCNLGVAYLYKGSLNEAINQLKKAIEINPRDGTAHFNLVIAYLGKGLNEEAMEEYQKAIEIDARFAKSQQGLQVTSWLKNLQKR
jgi:tetratricopeptide (TPR) repeat protein